MTRWLGLYRKLWNSWPAQSSCTYVECLVRVCVLGSSHPSPPPLAGQKVSPPGGGGRKTIRGRGRVWGCQVPLVKPHLLIAKSDLTYAWSCYAHTLTHWHTHTRRLPQTDFRGQKFSCCIHTFSLLPFFFVSFFLLSAFFLIFFVMACLVLGTASLLCCCVHINSSKFIVPKYWQSCRGKTV